MGLGDSLLPSLTAFNQKVPTQALDAAVKTVQTFCDWMIAPPVVGASASVWSRDGKSLTLPTMHLTGITSITQNGVTIPTSNVTFESYGIVNVISSSLSGERSFFLREYKVTVVFDHGYADFPEDVKDVILQCAQRAISDTRGIVPRTSGGPVFIENRGPRLEDTDKARLAPYMLGGFA
jgi:hypothetical protein